MQLWKIIISTSKEEKKRVIVFGETANKKMPETLVELQLSNATFIIPVCSMLGLNNYYYSFFFYSYSSSFCSLHRQMTAHNTHWIFSMWINKNSNNNEGKKNKAVMFQCQTIWILLCAKRRCIITQMIKIHCICIALCF